MAIKKIQLKDASLNNVLHPETDWSLIQNIPTDLGKVKKVNNQTPGTDGNVTVTAANITYSGSTTVKTGIDNAASAASTAQSTANSASSAASTAQSTAESAATEAQSAASAASAANTAAVSAGQAASTAQSMATAAQNTADLALSTAQGRSKSFTYMDTTDYWSSLSASDNAYKNNHNVGDVDFLIVSNVPDCWFADATDTGSYDTTVTTKAQLDTFLANANQTSALIAYGSNNHFAIAKLETQKVTVPSYATSAQDVATTSSAGSANTVSRGDHKHKIAVATGDSNGQVKIAGTNVAVKGLGSAAYTASTAYAAKSTETTASNAATAASNAQTTANGAASRAEEAYQAATEAQSDVDTLSTTVTGKQDKQITAIFSGVTTVEGTLRSLANTAASAVYYEVIS